MATTIIGPTAATGAVTATPPLVYVRRTWSDSWTWEPSLRFRRGSCHTTGADLDMAELESRYGYDKAPHEAGFSTKLPADWTRAWVRVDVVAPGGAQTIFLGRISGEGRHVHGQDNGPSGRQTWAAYGPLQILRKIHVGRSFWLVDGEEKELGWIPSLNRRDELDTIRGNRSAEKSGDSYLFGSTAVWTHRDFLEYLLDRFVDESDAGGPAWTIGGQDELLDELTETVEMATTQTAAEIIRRLIPPRLGLDYKITPTADGFEITVFSLLSQETSFQGATLPRNPRSVRVDSGSAKENIRTHLATSDAQAFGKVRILGRRLVCAFSLYGPAVLANGNVSPHPLAGDLVKRWTNTLQSDYENGSGSSDPTVLDQDRTAERFRTVFSAFGAPNDWDLYDGKCAPKLDQAGQRQDGPADFQTRVRSTLSWLPLRQGWDYTVDPPIDGNPEGVEADLRPPAAWLTLRNPAGEADPWSEAYQPAEALGVGVHALRDDWGVLLTANPRHLLALGHFLEPSAVAPLVDYETTVITIAVETDQRLCLEVEIPDAAPSDGVYETVVPDAHYWFLAPDTILDVDPADPTALVSAGPLELRNDADRLALVMAGVLARYYATRARAEIHVKGLLPWTGLLGQILETVEEAGAAHQIQAPITSIEWSMPQGPNDSPLTVIRTGFAQ